MTKNQIRKAAYQAIYKEGKTHNETFIELKAKTKMDGDGLADIISGTISRAKHDQTKPIWTAYLAVLGAIILLRLLYLYVLFNGFSSNIANQPIFILMAVVFSLAVPAYGFYGILTARRNVIVPVALLLILGIFRGLRHVQNPLNWDSLIVYALVAGLVVLSILLWTKWKTPYSKKVETVSTEAGEKKKLRYEFEESSVNSELLDDMP
ncbi:MAG: hypothetical protein NXI10_16415 [bacterium]|nr:hypothetical protein [bacterium]